MQVTCVIFSQGLRSELQPAKMAWNLLSHWTSFVSSRIPWVLVSMVAVQLVLLHICFWKLLMLASITLVVGGTTTTKQYSFVFDISTVSIRHGTKVTFDLQPKVPKNFGFKPKTESYSLRKLLQYQIMLDIKLHSQYLEYSINFNIWVSISKT